MDLGRGFKTLIVTFPVLFAGISAFADHLPENLFQQVYDGIIGQKCRYLEQTGEASQNCETSDPARFQCWRDKLHMYYYSEEELLSLLEEIEASNQKYPYYNKPYYNEFFSDLNWDTLMRITDSCPN